MPRHRRYTGQQKAKAVAEAEVNGAEAAAQSTGIPRTTILYWLDRPEFVELRQKTREEKRDGYRVLIAKAQARLAELIPTMEPRDLTILLGVAQDKDLLLSGDATARTETITDGLSDDEKRRLRGAIARAARLEARGSGDGDGVEVPGQEGTAAPAG